MEVIDINTAEKLGMVSDIDVDISTGRIKSLVIPNKDLLSFPPVKNREISIPWSAVRAVGREHILVNMDFRGELSL